MDKDKIIEIGKYLNTKYLIIRNVDKNDKLDKQDKYIQLLYDNYLDLKITNNTLNKGIDELLKKYEEEKDKLYIYADGYRNPLTGELGKVPLIPIECHKGEILLFKKIIQDLKKLKGE